MAVLVLWLILLRLSGSGSESVPHEFVREGNAAVLPCDNVQPGQERCGGTVWLFISAYDSGTYVELIRLGRTGSSVPQQLSERLSLTQDCGLQIKAVRSDEAGLYFCQQYNSSGTRPPLVPGPTLVPDAHVILSVVSVTEDEKNDLLTLSCSVYTALESSSVRMKWLLNGQVDQDSSEILTTRLGDGLKINIKKTHPATANKRLLTCEVTYEDLTHQFSLSSEESEMTPPPPPHTTSDEGDVGDDEEDESGAGSSLFKGLLVRNVLLSVVMAALVLGLGVLFIWSKRQGLRARRNRVDEDAVVYENVGAGGPSVRIHRAPPAAAEGEGR